MPNDVLKELEKNRFSETICREGHLMKIFTLTLNPAFDIHCTLDNFRAQFENIATISQNDAGGKGINISRALSRNGVENTAFVLLGDENGDAFLKKLDLEGINYKSVYCYGRIRENITIHEQNNPETRLSFTGFKVTDDIIDNFFEKLLCEPLEDSFVCLTGSLPTGADIKKIKEYMLKIKEKGAKIIIDSRSFTKDDILDVSPWLIKPNEYEIKAFIDDKICTIEDAKAAAEKIKEMGVLNVLISLGGKGAALSSACGSFIATAPKIDVLSTVGAGDSMIAGFLSSVIKADSMPNALKTAVSFGSAACLTEGTNPPNPTDIKKIFDDISVK